MTKNLHGAWKLGDAIGEGGQGSVYRTKDKDGNLRAIKVIRLRGGDKKRIKRVKREIQIIKNLHEAPNIVRIYDDNVGALDENSNSPQEIYYVMDFARYGSLAHNDFYIGDIELSLLLFKEILTGVSGAHKSGIVHRDIKPENILLYPTQKTIAVADFGLGHIAAVSDEITESDEVLGPRYFMAPEQYKDPANADQKSDIYSLGKVLYYMLTAKGRTFREEVNLTKDYSGSNPYLPLIQEKLLNKMVCTDPGKRFSDVEEILEVTEEIAAQISANSKRILKRDDAEVSFYDILAGERRQEFIDNFSKDLDFNMWAVELTVDELIKNKRQVQLDKLKKDLLSKNPKGKARAALEATFAYVENPETLKLSENGRFSFASYYLAKYFQNATTYEPAHTHIVAAIEKETDSSLRLKYLLLFSKVCSNCKCALPHDFDRRLLQLLQSSPDAEVRAKLFKMLGNHYRDSGEKILGLRFIEAYLHLKPYDNELRFKCAWEYSELGQIPLALHHYDIHKRVSKEPDSTVENNVGVLYNKKDMDIKAMALYTQAYERGNTLAGSNVALRYTSIGLTDEAEKILRDIIAKHPDGDYDANVDKNLGNISRLKESEDEIEEQLRKTGALINQHNQKSIQMLAVNTLDWTGFWSLDIGPIIEIKATSDGLAAKKRSEKEILPMAFEGNLSIIKKLNINSSTYDIGLIYLINSNELRGYLLKDGEEYKEVKGERIVDIEAYEKSRSATLSDFIKSINPI